MTIGPVQLLVLGFNHPDFHGELLTELKRLRDNDMVRVVDSLVVIKDNTGNCTVDHMSNLTSAERVELGTMVGALLGLGEGGVKGMRTGAKAGARAAKKGRQLLPETPTWDVLDEIPNDSAAALVLLEHHWAVPLRDAIVRTGGFPIGERFISPEDLVAIGMIKASDVEETDVVATAHVGSMV